MHEQFLLAALEQARLGQGSCAPNPAVGAIAVQNKKIIAQAWHHGAGTPHAEQLLLAQIPHKTPGIILYVTLEPCNHWGRTPPCVDAIIQHGVEEVVFAYKDPNPIVAKNHSSATLEEHGIKVRHIPLPEIDAFYASYTFWTATARPRVTVKLAHSIDGLIAGPEGLRLHLSNDLCAQFTHKMRAQSDVLLTTARTIAQDNPLMNARCSGSSPVAKPVAILDSHLSLDPKAAVFANAERALIFHHQDKPQVYPNSTYFKTPLREGRLDLHAVMKQLGDLGFHDVWVEAGGTLFTALHQAGLVHRTYLYIVPKSVGADGVRAYQDSGLFDRPHKLSWQAMDDNMIACIDWQEDTCLQD